MDYSKIIQQAQQSAAQKEAELERERLAALERLEAQRNALVTFFRQEIIAELENAQNHLEEAKIWAEIVNDNTPECMQYSLRIPSCRPKGIVFRFLRSTGLAEYKIEYAIQTASFQTFFNDFTAIEPTQENVQALIGDYITKALS